MPFRRSWGFTVVAVLAVDVLIVAVAATATAVTTIPLMLFLRPYLLLRFLP
jgi:hypothetical protein